MTKFKNALIYRLSRDLNWDVEEIEQQLVTFAYAPCGPHDFAKSGWIAPIGEQLAYVSSTNGILLTLQREEKLLPKPVINDALRAKVEKLEGEQHRKLKKTERDSIRDEVVQTLLPRAFSRYSKTNVWIDTKQGLIVVDAASAKKAEDALALLRKSLGSLPVVPLMMASPIELTLTEWVRSGNAPAGFVLEEEAVLKAVLDGGGVIRCQDQELTGDEIATNIVAGKLVTSLGLNWSEKISFVLNDAGSIKKIKFADVLIDQNCDIDSDDYAQRFDADFHLYTGEMRQLITALIAALGGEMGQEAGQPDIDEPFDDELYNEAVVFATGKNSISVSALQREFRVGYNRASHLIERMEAEHICSHPDRSGRRSIFGGQTL